MTTKPLYQYFTFTGMPAHPQGLTARYDDVDYPLIPGYSSIVAASRNWRSPDNNGPANSFDRSRFLAWVASLSANAVVIMDWEAFAVEWDSRFAPISAGIVKLDEKGEALKAARLARPDVKFAAYGVDFTSYHNFIQRDLGNQRQLAGLFATNAIYRVALPSVGGPFASLFDAWVADNYVDHTISDADVVASWADVTALKIRSARTLHKNVWVVLSPYKTNGGGNPPLNVTQWLRGVERCASLADAVLVWRSNGPPEAWANQSWWDNETAAAWAAVPDVV